MMVLDDQTTPLGQDFEKPAQQPGSDDNPDTCAAQLAQAREQLLYLRADFDNFRRQADKTQARLAQHAQALVWRDIVAIVDDFERAIADGTQRCATETERTTLEGFSLVYKKLGQLLEQHKITVVPADGTFDPVKHEAIAQVPGSSKPTGTIVDVLQKGYEQNGVILRPARVTVAQ